MIVKIILSYNNNAVRLKEKYRRMSLTISPKESLMVQCSANVAWEKVEEEDEE